MKTHITTLQIIMYIQLKEKLISAKIASALVLSFIRGTGLNDKRRVQITITNF